MRQQFWITTVVMQPRDDKNKNVIVRMMIGIRGNPDIFQKCKLGNNYGSQHSRLKSLLRDDCSEILRFMIIRFAINFLSAVWVIIRYNKMLLKKYII